MINLKSLNSYLVRTPHFKMETIQSLKDVLRQGDFMVKLDLKDAYLTVPVHQDDHRYLRFMWKGKAFEFTTLPFGLAPASFFFAKLLKPVVSFLRLRGIRLIVYLDDILIMASSAEKATRDLQVVLRILAHLGFIINMKKCLTSPTQMIEFLGFILNSLRMVLSLPKEKVFQIRKECRRMLNQTEVSSRSLAHLIGLMTAEWCVHRKITLHAVHIPGRRNEIADWESHHMSDYSDWQLDREVFKRVQRALGPFSVDLFASFRNIQLEVYFSWKPNPSAEAVDALCQVWSNHRPYLFPPFALIGRSLHKVRMDRVTQAV